ncbi:hypothetical protein OEG84_14745 [Hoeflea sp. G2-23]|uniref:ABC transporter permease n=1 Tax=Hoeflea algicola TaxID=2983763 RepID=A0ABT3ZCH7_9HYPH|nr:hypothetical protein [Hoeflea algicola]MCY0148926.1 hypothetical protein [Hoeflea algicola]
MDIFFRLMLRMAYWVRRPPSKSWLVAVGTAIAISAVIVIIEHTIGWPDWAKVDRLPRFPAVTR